MPELFHAAFRRPPRDRVAKTVFIAGSVPTALLTGSKSIGTVESIQGDDEKRQKKKEAQHTTFWS